MTPARPRKTLADYLAIALCPLLIMVLVGSIVFFLLEIGYERRWNPRWEGRLRWALFWFVLGSVLISRISIVRGPQYAAVYGLAFAAAMSLFIFRFLGFAVSVLCLLAFIWWCASKLTWDCTLIEDDADASGEGLLQAGGMDEVSVDGSENPRRAIAARAWWRRLLQNRSTRGGPPHAPGLWVVYFSLVALPVFGFGQMLVRAGEAAAGRHSFQLLWAYVVAALGLLLATSFLGLRRYLRQRHLRMPAPITASWIGLGSLLAGAVLLLCLILPRPDATYSITQVVDRISSAAQEASQYALLSGEAGEGEGRRIGKGEMKDRGESKQKRAGQGTGRPDEKSGAGAAGSQQSREKGGGAGQASGQAQGGGDQPKQGAAGGKQQGQGSSLHASGRDSESPGLRPQQTAGWIGSLVKWLIYGLMALAALFVAWRKRRQITAWWRQFLQGLRDFWNSLFGRRAAGTEAAPGLEATAESVRAFADYDNPFAGGDPSGREPAELLVHSFEALQAWGREHGCSRKPDQTPLEFARTLGRIAPVLEDEARQTARLYTRLAYAGGTPPPGAMSTLEQLWTQMTTWAVASSQQPPAEAEA